MRDLIPIRETLKEMMRVVFEIENHNPKCATYSKSFQDVGHDGSPVRKFYEDNATALKHAIMPKISPRTKDIGIPMHWFRSKLISLEITVVHISSAMQLADQYAKGLPQDSFERGRKAVMGW
jgi:hypothetical protein